MESIYFVLSASKIFQFFAQRCIVCDSKRYLVVWHVLETFGNNVIELTDQVLLKQKAISQNRVKKIDLLKHLASAEHKGSPRWTLTF